MEIKPFFFCRTKIKDFWFVKYTIYLHIVIKVYNQEAISTIGIFIYTSLKNKGNNWIEFYSTPLGVFSFQGRWWKDRVELFMAI